MSFLLKRIANKLAVKLISFKFNYCGEGVHFDAFSCRFVDPSLISLGDFVFIGPRAHISANIIIEKYVMFGPNVTVLGGNHNFGEVGEWNRFLKPKAESSSLMSIGTDAWIGAGSIILPGVKIGRGSVVGAGSVVVKDVESFTVVAGNPAKFIRHIFEDDQLKRHLKEIDN